MKLIRDGFVLEGTVEEMVSFWRAWYTRSDIAVGHNATPFISIYPGGLGAKYSDPVPFEKIVKNPIQSTVQELFPSRGLGIRYFSESKNASLYICDMHTLHIKNAICKASSLSADIIHAMLDELMYRAQCGTL